MYHINAKGIKSYFIIYTGKKFSECSSPYLVIE